MNRFSPLKTRSLYFVALVYLLAFFVAVISIYMLPFSILINTLYADLAATLVVFIFSRIYKNSSIYDPYWSVAPILIVGFWLVNFGKSYFDYREMLIFILVCWWGFRLTWNWILRWNGLKDEDFRYVDLKKSKGIIAFTLDFVGIHFFPTLIVFVGLLPVYHILSTESISLNYIDGFAIVLTVVAILIETIADNQLRDFKRNNNSGTLKSGLWKYVKYPNYLGENLFWWGLFLFALAASADYWKLIFAPISMNMLFILISIPMMKKRLAKRN